VRTFGNNIALIFFAVVKIMFAALLDGALAFVVAAAATAFITWLAGSATPRDWALQIGAVVGGLVWFVEFSFWMVSWVQRVSDALRQAKIERVLKEP